MRLVHGTAPAVPFPSAPEAESAWSAFRTQGFDLGQFSPHDVFIHAWQVGREAARAHKRSKMSDGFVGRTPPALQLEIRQRYATERVTQTDLSIEYGIDQATINRIIRGRKPETSKKARAVDPV